MREPPGKVVSLAQWKWPTPHEPLTADGTLIEARTSMKRFVPKDGPGKPPKEGGKNPAVDFKGENRSNETHTSTTDDQARLFKKSAGDKSRLCYTGHTPMENRHGLVIDAETTQATGKAEQEAAPNMAAKQSGSAINGRKTRHKGYAASPKKRKLLEDVLG